MEGKLERVMGIEPTWSAWKAEALPLSYTRDKVFVAFPTVARNRRIIPLCVILSAAKNLKILRRQLLRLTQSV